jgi:hypothetical protein
VFWGCGCKSWQLPLGTRSLMASSRVATHQGRVPPNNLLKPTPSNFSSDTEETLAPLNNVQHEVLAPVERDPHMSLLALAEQYFRTQVAGQAEGTVDTKQWALACFLEFYASDSQPGLDAGELSST